MSASSALAEVFAEPPRYEDGGAGAFNAALLEKIKVRPAFFDMSCLIYRMMFAKADEYGKRCGTDCEKISWHVAADVLCDVTDACRHFACGPVLAFDSWKSNRRETIYPEYKGNRGKSKKSANEEIVVGCKPEINSLLRSVFCPTYNLQSFCVHGYEGDDIIASFVLGLKQSGLMQKAEYEKPVVIVSNDGDLQQLLLDGVRIADVSTGILYGAEEMFRHTKIRFTDVVAAKCIGGCKSDNVGNVPGCGDKTVAEILEKRTTEVTLKKARQALEGEVGAAILRRNLRLVRLPLSGMPPLRLAVKAWPRPGIPDAMAAALDSRGVPRSAWPSFADISLPRPTGAVPVCDYRRKETTE